MVILATISQRQDVVLHGSIPVGKRKELIEKFQRQEYVSFSLFIEFTTETVGRVSSLS
jgi:hypothetical protein